MGLIFKCITKYKVTYKDENGKTVNCYASGQSREKLASKMIEMGYTLISFGEDESNI